MAIETVDLPTKAFEVKHVMLHLSPPPPIMAGKSDIAFVKAH
jgi:hypothetical protein